MKKNTIVTIVVAAMVAASLSACGAKNEAPAETPAVVEEVTAEVTPEVVEEEVTPEVEEVAEEVTPEVEEEIPVEEEEEGVYLADTNLKFKSLNGVEPENTKSGNVEYPGCFIVYSLSGMAVGDGAAVEEDFERYPAHFEKVCKTPLTVDVLCAVTDVTGTTSYVLIGHATAANGQEIGRYLVRQDVGLDEYIDIEINDSDYTGDVEAAMSYCEDILLSAPFELVEDAE